MISIILFDALHTLVAPRLPIATQYAIVFEPFLGRLPPDSIKQSFKSALKKVQTDRPAYNGQPDNWWSEVVYRTAVGAGAEPTRVERALPDIVPALLHRFSSKEGYKLYDDALPTLRALRERKIKIGLVSNTDLRMKAVLDDLEVTHFFQAMSFSEEERVEKPSPAIFLRTLEKMDYGGPPSGALHVGDNPDDDYMGATQAGLSAFLLRRAEGEDQGESEIEVESVPSNRIISSLSEVPSLLTSPP